MSPNGYIFVAVKWQNKYESCSIKQGFDHYLFLWECSEKWKANRVNTAFLVKICEWHQMFLGAVIAGRFVDVCFN